MDDDILAIASRFRGGPDAIALFCSDVLFEGAPILCVVRKDDVWQFLCGRDHSGEYVREWDDDKRVTTVRAVVARDPSVASLASMNDHHILLRRSVSDPWVPYDDLSGWWV